MRLCLFRMTCYNLCYNVPTQDETQKKHKMCFEGCIGCLSSTLGISGRIVHIIRHQSNNNISKTFVQTYPRLAQCISDIPILRRECRVCQISLSVQILPIPLKQCTTGWISLWLNTWWWSGVLGHMLYNSFASIGLLQK